MIQTKYPILQFILFTEKQLFMPSLLSPYSKLACTFASQSHQQC